MGNIVLKKNEERRLLAGHSWIFSNEIDKTSELESDVCLCNLFDSRGNFLGKGFRHRIQVATDAPLRASSLHRSRKTTFHRLNIGGLADVIFGHPLVIDPDGDTYRQRVQPWSNFRDYNRSSLRFLLKRFNIVYLESFRSTV